LGKNQSQGSTLSEPGRVGIQVVENDRLEEDGSENQGGSISIARSGQINSDLNQRELEARKNARNSTKHLLNPNLHDQLYEEDTIIEEAEGRDIQQKGHD
jgi:PBP1b-binding outer membrane lipoprotein LpoB